MNAASGVIYEFGEYRLDPSNYLLARRDGTRVPLTPRVFQTLVVMVEHHGIVLDKERLMEAVWPDSIVEENNLSQNVSALRRVFGDTPGAQRFIVTVPGRGYRFAADVTVQDGNRQEERLFAQPDAELPQIDAKPEAAAPKKVAAAPPLLIKAVIAALLIIAVSASVLALRRRGSQATPGSAALPASAAAVWEKSIAVLPFADLSPTHDQEYFCDGVQEEILTRLAKVADLKVISRTSTQRFRTGPKDLPEIARQLGVANVLEGAVQRADGQVRVTVQLINARSDSHVWAETYDRNLTDVFAVESEIAKTIADKLQAKLSGSEQRAIAARPTENTEAHQLYLKGIYFSSKRNVPALRTAIDYFHSAVSNDPNYGLAYAGMADAYTLLSVLGGQSPTETVSRAKAAAEKALALDETLPEAHNSLGLVLAFFDFDFAQSKRQFERALELNPNYATAHQQFGNVNLVKVGDFDRGIAEGSRALELDPLSLAINTDLAQNYLMARRYDEAVEQSRKTLAIDPRFYPAHWMLGEALQMKGQLSEAVAEYKKMVELTDDLRARAMLAQAQARVGEPAKAQALLSQVQQTTVGPDVGAVRLALIHLALGEKEKALEKIEQACREPADPDVINLKVEPLFDPLRGDPRFERSVAKFFGSAKHE
ncbi:MAG: winged helix-turn-helix domain-containing protein [Chthoniobacterales bacterium]